MEKSLVAAAVSNAKATLHQPVTVKNDNEQVMNLILFESHYNKQG